MLPLQKGKRVGRYTFLYFSEDKMSWGLLFNLFEVCCITPASVKEALVAWQYLVITEEGKLEQQSLTFMMDCAESVE